MRRRFRGLKGGAEIAGAFELPASSGGGGALSCAVLAFLFSPLPGGPDMKSSSPFLKALASAISLPPVSIRCQKASRICSEPPWNESVGSHVLSSQPYPFHCNICQLSKRARGREE
ncbi:hypothetical protein HYDPIDRAFT_105913 [Hydnomerulius pinastri MD-312]|nr:hypothetical protein HYDPIDRAFT_105913 [Hydnomerulius pinastri MD-312]